MLITNRHNTWIGITEPCSALSGLGWLVGPLFQGVALRSDVARRWRCTMREGTAPEKTNAQPSSALTGPRHHRQGQRSSITPRKPGTHSNPAPQGSKPPHKSNALELPRENRAPIRTPAPQGPKHPSEGQRPGNTIHKNMRSPERAKQ